MWIASISLLVNLILLVLMLYQQKSISSMRWEINILKYVTDANSETMGRVISEMSEMKDDLVKLDDHMVKFLNDIDVKYYDIIQTASKKNVDKWDNLRKAFLGGTEE